MEIKLIVREGRGIYDSGMISGISYNDVSLHNLTGRGLCNAFKSFDGVSTASLDQVKRIAVVVDGKNVEFDRYEMGQFRADELNNWTDQADCLRSTIESRLA